MYGLSSIRSTTSPARLRSPCSELTPVTLADVTEALGTSDCIGGLHRRGREEELQPFLDATLFSNCLKTLVILAAVASKYGLKYKSVWGSTSC